MGNLQGVAARMAAVTVAEAEAPSIADGSGVFVQEVASPLGDLIVGADDTKLYLVEFSARPSLQDQLESLARMLGCIYHPGSNAITESAARQLNEYFAGTRRSFELPVAMPGTRLQQEVWRHIAAIPYGATTTYGQLAAAVARPRAARAIGRVTGQNRLAVVVPCHRVVAADGSLAGYAAGTARKRWLLEHES